MLESSTFYFFEDKDGDGYGAGAAQNRCEAVPGLVGNQDDCDDESIRINPEAAEICDDIDNDCDGLFDDEDDSLSARLRPIMQMEMEMVLEILIKRSMPV